MERRAYKEQPVVSITFDTDNCPEEAIEFVQERLDRRNIPGTFFCTQRYESLREPHEAAVHPFLREFFKLDELFDPLHALQEKIPEAVGNRCHQLTCNGALYRHLGELGFLYDSAWPMFLHEHIEPIHLHTGILELPVFYVENLFIERGMDQKLHESLRAPGLKVFLFHPVHIFHNSTKDTFFEIMKVPYPDRYKPELVAKGEGVLTFFDALLALLSEERIMCATCKDIALSENAA